MLEQNKIFVAGMPRAGSMWTYNVVRRLIVLAGKAPWPERVPTDERQIIQQAFTRPAGDGKVYCIKTHYAIAPDRPDVRILCNIRDIRDATLSFMRFMKCPFMTALESARESMKITDHYLGSGSLSVLPVDYDDVVGASSSVVVKIAEFIGVEASDAEVGDIVAQLSRERMEARLERLGAVAVDQAGGIASRSEADLYTSIRNVDGSYRIYDYGTGFQSNHITSSRAGEWREVFDAERQRVLNELLGDWLRRYGYEV
jgi:hypothetical protein